MGKKDYKVIAIIWIAAIALSVLTSFIFQFGYQANPEAINPTPDHPTTSWFWAPATTLAEYVHASTAWAIMIIFPFFYGPIMMLSYIIYKFSSSRRKSASTFHENVRLEVFWTIMPAIALVMMALPAYRVLAYMETEPSDVDVVVDVTGHQFYWQYDYPKYGVTISDDGSGEEPLVLPVDSNIVLHGQATQVNHAWWVPAFALKFDVIPGRITRGWFHTTQEGFFKGQCAELCGWGHAFMWIHVKVVPDKEYYQWLKDKGATFPADEIDRISAILGEDLSLDEAAAGSQTAPPAGDQLVLAGATAK